MKKGEMRGKGGGPFPLSFPPIPPPHFPFPPFVTHAGSGGGGGEEKEE